MNTHLINDLSMIIVIRMLASGVGETGNDLYRKLHVKYLVVHMTDAKNTYHLVLTA